MRKLSVGLFAAALAFAGLGITASAGARPRNTFVVVLDADNEVPHCNAATNAARGVAVFHVTDEAGGTVEWKLVANNLPGTPTAAHIHVAPKGSAGPVVQPLPPTPGAENGVIGEGAFTNKALLTAIRANPANYYVNVHSNLCTSGVIRGQFGDHGGLAGETIQPTSSSAVLIASGGFANTLDPGDKVQFVFTDTGCATSCGMSIAANATIRVTDSDCGNPTGWPGSQNGAPANCTAGTNTVADIICGSNATCTRSDGSQTNNVLTVIMTGSPTIQSAGNTPGAQYPVVVTDSVGITDLSGNVINWAGSADRIFGPLGQ